jgi:hypothetical protein
MSKIFALNKLKHNKNLVIDHSCRVLKDIKYNVAFLRILMEQLVINTNPNETIGDVGSINLTYLNEKSPLLKGKNYIDGGNPKTASKIADMSAISNNN